MLFARSRALRTTSDKLRQVQVTSFVGKQRRISSTEQWRCSRGLHAKKAFCAYRPAGPARSSSRDVVLKMRRQCVERSKSWRRIEPPSAVRIEPPSAIFPHKLFVVTHSSFDTPSREWSFVQSTRVSRLRCALPYDVPLPYGVPLPRLTVLSLATRRPPFDFCTSRTTRRAGVENRYWIRSHTSTKKPIHPPMEAAGVAEQLAGLEIHEAASGERTRGETCFKNTRNRQSHLYSTNSGTNRMAGRFLFPRRSFLQNTSSFGCTQEDRLGLDSCDIMHSFGTIPPPHFFGASEFSAAVPHQVKPRFSACDGSTLLWRATVLVLVDAHTVRTTMGYCCRTGQINLS